MRLLIFTLLMLLTSAISFAQMEETENYLTKEENEEWLKNFEKLENIELQLNAIQEKITADAKYMHPRPGISLTGLTNQQRQALRKREAKKPKATAACKILFVLNAGQTYVLNQQNQQFNRALLKLLNASNIDSINSLSSGTTAIYGARASCGAVLLSSNEEQLIAKLKKLQIQ